MSDHGHDVAQGSKHPRLAELEGLVRDGTVDTIVIAFTDMQGRLMGKRVHGQAFLDGVVSHGAHFCTYLLGTDMEMNTPAGYRLMNWETGYGDWIAEPIWDQLFPAEKARVLHLLIEQVTYNAAEGEVSITFRPGGVRVLAREHAVGVKAE